MSAPLSRSHGRLGALLGATLMLAAMMVPATATAAIDLNALAATLAPGDAEGESGSITMQVSDTPDEVCFVLTTTFSSGDADPPTSVDINLQNGTLALHLADGVDVAGGATDCVASTAILNAALLESPANYQVNVTTAGFPITGIWGTVAWDYPQTDLNILTVVCPPSIQDPSDLNPTTEATCKTTVLAADDVSGDIPGGYTHNYAGVSDFDYHVTDGVRIDETIANASFPGALDCDSGTHDCDASGLYYHWSQLSADINVNIDPSIATIGLRVGAVAAFEGTGPGDDVPLTEESDGSFTVDATGVTVTDMVFYLFGEPLADTTDPVVGTPIARFKANGSYASGFATLELTWTGSDVGSGLDHFNVQVSKDGGGWTTVDSSVAAFKVTTTAQKGHAYRFRVKAIDADGNASGWKSSAINELHAVSDGSSRVGYRGTWSSVAVAGASGGKVHRSTDKAATAKLSFFGRAVSWVAPNGLTYGQAKVYIDGKYDVTINLNGGSASHLQVYKKTFSKNAGHTITVKVVATSGHPRVDVDAFLYLN